MCIYIHSIHVYIYMYIYIYVAFGEHPAAGGLYMSFWSLWHFAGPCGVSLALWVALGLHCGTLGFHFDTHGV